MEKKQFKYYAIRINNTIIFRRTLTQLQLIKSTLYKTDSSFKLEQLTYVGGRAIGCMSYKDWLNCRGKQIANHKCARITREQFKSLGPYVVVGEI